MCYGAVKVFSGPEFTGTRHRNHCPFCLWSKHLDLKVPGDRKSKCQGKMEPLGLTFKHEGFDKWGKKKEGELMLIFKCLKCGKISINRIAGDDKEEAILSIFEKSKELDKNLVKELKENDIDLLKESNRKEIERQLFGNI